MSDAPQPAPPEPPASLTPPDGGAADEGVATGDAVLTAGAVPRFSVTERLSHWFYALFFLVAHAALKLSTFVRRTLRARRNAVCRGILRAAK